MKSGKTLRNTLLVLAALALAVFLAVSFGLFSPSAHMWPSRVEGGQLYYTRHNCTLAYTPGGGSARSSCPGTGAAERRGHIHRGRAQLYPQRGRDAAPRKRRGPHPEGLGLFASRLNAQPDSLIVPLSDARGQ